MDLKKTLWLQEKNQDTIPFLTCLAFIFLKFTVIWKATTVN